MKKMKRFLLLSLLLVSLSCLSQEIIPEIIPINYKSVMNYNIEGVILNINSATGFKQGDFTYKESYYDINILTDGCVEYVLYNKKKDQFFRTNASDVKITIDKNSKRLKNWYLEIKRNDGYVIKFDLNERKIVNIFEPNSEDIFVPKFKEFY
jgi:hypothetical protein